MPFSSNSGKAWTKRIVKHLLAVCSYNSILDVGAGAGSYANMIRPLLPQAELTGLEIWKPYIDGYKLQEKYDHVLNEDIREFLPQTTYGLAILGDVLEHMAKEEAVAVYTKLLDFCEFILISIPIVKYPQDEYRGNPYEKHVKNDWSHAEVLSSFSSIALHHLENEIGIYIGFNPKLHSAEEVISANQPTVAVYGIYKNEEKFMERFLHSVQDADEIVLCDTGSSDGTNAVIQSFCIEHPECHLKTHTIAVLPFRFDDARNAALSLVDSDIDLCISLDMDETLMEGWKELLVAKWDIQYTRYCHKFKTIWDNRIHAMHWHDRIHARSGYTWKLPVHEILEFRGEEVVCKMEDFWICHEPDTQKAHASYMPLLEQSVSERPDVWKSWSFLAWEYLAAGRLDEASDAIEKAFALADSDKGYLYEMKYNLYKHQQKPESALFSIDQAIALLPGRREPCFEKAKYLHQMGRHVQAFFVLKEAQARTAEITDYRYNTACWGEAFDRFMAEVLEAAKKDGLGL